MKLSRLYFLTLALTLCSVSSQRCYGEIRDRLIQVNRLLKVPQIVHTIKKTQNKSFYAIMYHLMRKSSLKNNFYIDFGR